MTSNMNLMLHCGAERVERTDGALYAEPVKLGSQHNPIRHIDFIRLVEEQLKSFGLTIRQEQFGATHDGGRFFGLLEVVNGYDAADYATIIGLRASHDQSIAAGLVAGSGVFVCDNLCFSGEVKIGTKQTTNLLQRLPELTHEAVKNTKVLIQHQHDRFEAYKGTEISPRIGDAAIVELVRRNAISPSQAGKVIQEWDNPTYEEFTENGDSIWKLHNAVTEVYKPTNGHTAIATMPARSQALTKFCDELADISW